MRVLVLNAWDSNRGDEALVRALYLLLRQACPGCTMDVVPLYRRPLRLQLEGMDSVKGRYGEDYMLPPITHAERVLSILDRATIGRKVSRKLRKVVRGGLCWLALRGYLSSLSFMRKYDYILFAPQGQTISAGHSMLDCALFSLLAARESGVSYSILGVSMGPFDGLSETTLARIGHALEGAERIVLREDTSMRFVSEAFPNLRNVSTAVDIAFAMETPTIRTTRDKARVNTQNSAYRGSIGACISLSPQNGQQTRVPEQQYWKDYKAKLVQFFGHVLASTQKKLVLLPHVDRDFEVLHEIVRQFKNPDDAQVVPLGLDDEGHRAIIRSLDFFVSMRYHPTIFCICEEVPFMSVQQHFKVPGMLAKIGLPAYSCLQDDDLDTYVRTFDLAWRNAAAQREEIAAARQRAARISEGYHFTLEEVLQKRFRKTRPERVTAAAETEL